MQTGGPTLGVPASSGSEGGRSRLGEFRQARQCVVERVADGREWRGDVDEHHPPPGLGQASRARPPDPQRRTGDERDPPRRTRRRVVARLVGARLDVTAVPTREGAVGFRLLGRSGTRERS